MYFKNADHKSLLDEYQIQANTGNDREYGSALYLLAATGKPLGKYIRKWNIDIRGIVTASSRWSSGEKALVKLAVNVFTDGGYKAQVNEIFRQLDSDNFRAALEGLAIRYGH